MKDISQDSRQVNYCPVAGRPVRDDAGSSPPGSIAPKSETGAARWQSGDLISGPEKHWITFILFGGLGLSP